MHHAPHQTPETKAPRSSRTRLERWLVAGLGLALGASALAIHPPELADAHRWAHELEGAVATPLAAESKPSRVTLHEVSGPQVLAARFEHTFSDKLDQSPLTFVSPGVEAMAVHASVVDETTKTDSGDLNIRITASLLLIDQPTNAVRGSLSASAVVTIDAAATPEVQRAMKEQAVDAVAASLHSDLAGYVASRS